MNPSQPPTPRLSALTASARLTAFISSRHRFRECGHWPQCSNALRKWAGRCVATGLLLVMAMLLAGPESARAQSEGDLRLEDSDDPRGQRGRLEISHDGEWKTICGSGFATTVWNLSVACKQLGHVGEKSFYRILSGSDFALYNVLSAPEDRSILPYSFECRGGETRLWDCPKHFISNLDQQCSHDNDAAIWCSAANNTLATGRPTITGTVQVGKTLTADTTEIEDADGITKAYIPEIVSSFRYVWLADDVKFYGGSYEKTVTLTVAQLSKRIEVRVSFKDDEGFDEVITSEPTALVVAADAADNTPPTGLPTITGTAQVGQTLTAGTSDIADGNGLRLGLFRYQWLADDVVIDGATDKTHSLTVAQLSTRVKVQVSIQDDLGFEETRTSGPTDAVVAADPASNTPATGDPMITGTLQVGETLTANPSDITDGNGLRLGQFRYQWLADDTAISNATSSTYTLMAAQVSARIKVQVSIRDDHGFEETRTSEPTDAVVAADDARPPVTSSDGDLRLTGGGSDAAGLLEIYYDGQWGVVCGDTFLHIDVAPAVACRQMGFADGALSRQVAIGQDRQVFLDNVRCNGGESNLVQCDTNMLLGENLGCRRNAGGAIISCSTTVTNQAPTGKPEISGAPGVKRTLTVRTRKIIDRDGPVPLSFTYQWLADDVAIPDAAVSTYMLTAADAGKTISVRVTYTDADGTVETISSAPTAVVRAETQATGVPRITGGVVVGQTVTADTSGIRDPDGLDISGFTYQWLADDADISGAAASTYTLTLADRGKEIKVRVGFTDVYGFSGTATSAASRLAGLPKIRERFPQVGRVVTADTSDVGPPSLSFTYQWLADDVTISGATESTYRLTAAEEGKRISVRASFTNASDHQETLTSAKSEPVDPTGSNGDVRLAGGSSSRGLVQVYYEGEWGIACALDFLEYEATVTCRQLGFADGDLDTKFVDSGNRPVLLSDLLCHGDESRLVDCRHAGLGVNNHCRSGDGVIIECSSEETGTVADSPTITGTARVGEVLSVDTSGITDADGPEVLTFTYQWLADAEQIDGATEATYTPEVADAGKQITVEVSFTDGTNNEEKLTSQPTEVVAATNQVPTGSPAITGTAQVGEVLSVDTSGITDADGPEMPTFTYQWLADAVQIDRATEATYTPEVADAGKQITVEVSFTDGANNEEKLTSQPTEVVEAANQVPTGSPAITGTAQVGEALSVDTSGIMDADGPEMPTFSYQWLADGVQIDEATEATYTPEVADAGKQITVEVSFTDGANNEEKLTSEPTEAVVARQMAVRGVSVSYTGGAYTATEGAVGAVVNLTLSSDPERTVEIPIVATTASTATDSDYTISPMTVTFANGETSKDVNGASGGRRH